jgi:cyclophilin family peptidyl-prolyl cis-trans isomerase
MTQILVLLLLALVFPAALTAATGDDSVKVSFVNFSSEPMPLYWHNGNDFTQIGTVPPYETMGQTTFEGHRFAYGQDLTEYVVKEHPETKGRSVVPMLPQGIADNDTSVSVLCSTSKGDLRMTIKPTWSPLGAGRFLEMVHARYLDGCALNRVVPKFLTQLGIGAEYEQRTQWRHRNIPDDSPRKVPFQPGTMAYAGSGPNSRSTEFFIVMPDTPQSQLDYFGTNPWETPFGFVHPDDVVNTVGTWHAYGDMPPWGKGPSSQKIYPKDGYDYLKKEFPELDYVETCAIVDGSGVEEEL